MSLVWPDRQVTASMHLDEVATGSPVFGISPDGSRLVPLPRTASDDAAH